MVCSTSSSGVLIILAQLGNTAIDYNYTFQAVLPVDMFTTDDGTVQSLFPIGARWTGSTSAAVVVVVLSYI